MNLQDIRNGLHSQAKFLRANAITAVNSAKTEEALALLAQVKDLEQIDEALKGYDPKAQIDRETYISLLCQQASGGRAQFFIFDEHAGMMTYPTAFEAKKAAVERMDELGDDPKTTSLCWGIVFGRVEAIKCDNLEYPVCAGDVYRTWVEHQLKPIIEM